MQQIIKPSKGFQGEIKISSDKSISHRAAFIGAMGLGTSEISNYLFTGDCLSTLKCLRKLGVDIRKTEKNDLLIKGMGLHGFKEPGDILMAGNSGTTARFLLGLLSGLDFFSVIDGDSSLRRRPMKRIVIPLQQMGANFMGRNQNQYLPMAVKGGKLKPIEFCLPVPSAQLKSAIIFAALQCEGESEIREQIPSRDHTEKLLGYLDAGVEKTKNKICIKGKSNFKGAKIKVPNDFSSAAFVLASAVLVENSQVLIQDVGLNPTRTGFLQALLKMGGRVEIFDERIEGFEPIGNISVSTSDLHGIEIHAHDVPSMIDEIPLLALLSVRARGRTKISGAGELRIKESDRIRSIVDNFQKMGVKIDEQPDGFVIDGPQKIRGASLESFGDHRIAMTMAIAALIAEGDSCIKDFDCFNVSFPAFSELLRKWENGK